MRGVLPRLFLALLWLPCLLVLPPGGAVPLEAQAGLDEVTELRFQGNERFSDQVLARAIVTRETSCRSFILAPFCWAGADFAQEPYYFNNREFLRDEARIRLFYYQRGYRQTQVDTILDHPSDGEIHLTFRIREGEPVVVDSLSFRGLEELSDSTVARELVEDLPIGSGDPLSGIALDAAEDSLLHRLRNQGYAHAEVLQGYFIPSGTLRANVTFDLFPGPLTRFGSIRVTGNETVPESVVRRMLPFREGELYSQDLRFAGRRNLYNLEIFTFADVVADTSGVRPDSVLPVTVRVAEGDVHRVRTGLGFTTADCINAEAQWSSRNFFGGARRLQLTGRLSNVLTSPLREAVCRDAGSGEYGRLNWLLSAGFTQPWLFSPRNTLTASLFGERQSLPDIFVRQALGLNVGLTHSLTSYMPLTLSLRPQISSLDAAEIFFCSNYLICTPEDIDVLQGANWLSPVALSLSRDRRNQVLSPTRGHFALLDLEYAGDWTGSDFRYVRLLGEGAWYHQEGEGWVLATRLRGGWVSPGGFRGLGRPAPGREVVHPEKRLYAGGPNSVRGFAQNRLGPRVLQLPDVRNLFLPRETGESPPCTEEEIMNRTCDAGALDDAVFETRPTGGTSLVEGSLELRFPLGGRIWEGATFLDFGNVWGEDDDVELGQVELTPGLGVRYFSPIGPIRVDLAYRFAAGERLQVVTPQIRPFDPETDDPEDPRRIRDFDGNPLDYMLARDLALLEPRVLYGELDPWSLRRFQLHLSIGQAF